MLAKPVITQGATETAQTPSGLLPPCALVVTISQPRCADYSPAELSKGDWRDDATGFYQ
jgi:hypothetical protein